MSHIKKSIIIIGTHCKGCKLNIESQLKDMPGVLHVDVDHVSGHTTVEFDEANIDWQRIADKIINIGYSIEQTDKISLPEKPKNKSQLQNIFYYLIILVFIIILYFLQQKFAPEVLSQLNDKSISIGIIFLAGLLTGLHCISMCGGLVIAYTANSIKNQSICMPAGSGMKKNWLMHLRYNLGRLLSYAIMGAILGGLGSFFAINPYFTGGIIIIAAVFMLMMGISYLTEYPLLEKLKLAAPDFIGRYLFKNRSSDNPKGPFLIGLLNVFMPCGPLQAIEVFALSTGSMIDGALAMGIFAAGTIPFLFGFGNLLHWLSQDRIRKIVRVSGAVLIVLSLMMFSRGFMNLGVTFGNSKKNKTPDVSDQKNFQEINMDLTYAGYVPNTLYIKPGIPVRWKINVKQMSGCTSAIQIASLNIRKDLDYGENIIEFTPPDGVKEIKFSCGMQMVWGKFVIE